MHIILGVVECFPMKTCSRCSNAKPEDCFTKDLSQDDGLNRMCRSCAKEYRIARGLQKPDGWIRKTSDRVAYGRAYQAKNRDRLRVAHSRWVKAHPEARRAIEHRKYANSMKAKHGPGYVVGDPANRSLRTKPGMALEEALRRRAARKKLSKALERGKIERLPCEICGTSKSESHHPDYDAPLAVVWLCRTHHRQIHTEYGK